jgi:hypothetical protein
MLRKGFSSLSQGPFFSASLRRVLEEMGIKKTIKYSLNLHYFLVD